MYTSLHEGLTVSHEVADNRLLFWETGAVGVVLDCVVLLIIVLGCLLLTKSITTQMHMI